MSPSRDSSRPAAEPPSRRPIDPAAAGWRLVEVSQFTGLIGPLWERNDGAEAVFAFVAEARHLNNNDVVHGGMLLAVADDCMGRTAWRANGRRHQATIQLDGQFVAPVLEGQMVEVRCQIVRRTTSIIFMRCVLTVGARTVFTASGVWKVREGTIARV